MTTFPVIVFVGLMGMLTSSDIPLPITDRPEIENNKSLLSLVFHNFTSENSADPKSTTTESISTPKTPESTPTEATSTSTAMENPLVEADSNNCDCDYHRGGCVISQAASPGYACKCVYKYFWTCGGEVVGCSIKKHLCANPDKSYAACMLGKGDCGAY